MPSFTFANNINTTEGSAHLTASAPRYGHINGYARQKNFYEKGENCSGEEVREGLTALAR